MCGGRFSGVTHPDNTVFYHNTVHRNQIMLHVSLKHYISHQDFT